jgi:hypothetical protein
MAAGLPSAEGMATQPTRITAGWVALTILLDEPLEWVAEERVVMRKAVACALPRSGL